MATPYSRYSVTKSKKERMKSIGSKENTIDNEELADIFAMGIETSVPAGIEVPPAPVYEINQKSHATNFLQRYYYNTKPIFEIVTYSDGEPEYSSGFTLDGYMNKHHVADPTKLPGFSWIPYNDQHDSATSRRFNVDYQIHEGADERFIFNKTLTAASKSDEQPLVMLITAIGMEHAMIFIIHEGILYTSGFGYYNVPYPAAALYSADYLQPNASHKSQIVWIGLLDQCMAKNMNNDMGKIKRIVYNGAIEINPPPELKDDTYYKLQLYPDTPAEKIVCQFKVNPQAILSLPPSLYEYREISLNTSDDDKIRTNCIGWAMKTLNVNLTCGVIAVPSECISVPIKDIHSIFAYWPTTTPEKKENLNAILMPLQEKLGSAKTCANIRKSIGHVSTMASKKISAMTRKLIPAKGGRKRTRTRTRTHKRTSKAKRISNHKRISRAKRISREKKRKAKD